MSLIARHMEVRGVPTLCLASALDIIEAGNPPRAVFVDYPLGHTAGRPFDPENQYAVISQALDAFEQIASPGTVRRLEHRWSGDESWRAQAFDPSGADTRAPRDDSPRYQTEEDRRLAEASGTAGG